MRNLLRHYESPAAVLTASEESLCQHIPRTLAQKIRTNHRNKQIDTALKWATSDNRRLLAWSDNDYPAALLDIGDAPPILYAHGNTELLKMPLVAIVGSRSASTAGVRNAEIFARSLSDSGVGVVSGLAQGIDSAAHRGALTSGTGSTIAVVGTGIDITYPKINRLLAANIADNGLLLSEFPLTTKPLARNFPRRNRIISGIARACLVVEATLKSGSLITARTAAEQGRDVFAVPGSVNSPLHRGCHQLIREGAALTETVADILNELNLPVAKARHPDESDYADMVADTGEQATAAILAHINYEPTSVDDIAIKSGVDADKLLPELLALEIAGKIVAAAGGRYQRVS